MVHSKNLRISLFSIILSYIFTISIFSLITHSFLIKDFNQLQIGKNRDDVLTLLSKMNTKIQNISDSINDYSKWDDSYKFMNDLNKDYIYENFRDGTSTLEDLHLDFIVYADLKQKVVFSKYAAYIFKDGKQDFEENFLKQFEDTSSFDRIVKFKSTLLYLVKSEILKSDESGKVNGYIYSGKIITNESLEELTTLFRKVKLSAYDDNAGGVVMNFSNLKNIKVSTSFDKYSVINTIVFHTHDNQFITSIKAYSNKDIIARGEKTILLFNIVLSFFTFIIFAVLYSNQIRLQNYNKRLEEEVDKRTNELNKSLRNIEDKNKELYEISNTDYLTKIRNRRNFFIESENLLIRSIQEDKEFCILMIDIDYFKQINDTYGHDVGDKILINFCNIVNSIISDNDIFGRIGGEEFCIAFFDKDIHLISELSEEIRKRCENSSIDIDNQKVKFTVSSGLSNRKNFTEIDQVLQASDKLLYQAKEEGRNRLIRNCTQKLL
jgi:diguanylate cyclase (GGDEF)-like protein